jgi:hypothetical protein
LFICKQELNVPNWTEEPTQNSSKPKAVYRSPRDSYPSNSPVVGILIILNSSYNYHVQFYFKILTEKSANPKGKKAKRTERLSESGSVVKLPVLANSSVGGSNRIGSKRPKVKIML